MLQIPRLLLTHDVLYFCTSMTDHVFHFLITFHHVILDFVRKCQHRPKGTIHHHHLKGMIFYHRPKGTILHHHLKGMIFYHHPKGTIFYHRPKETIFFHRPKGMIFYHRPKGTI